MNYPSLLKKLIARQDLTENEAFDAVTSILAGELTEGQIGAFLATLSSKGETIEEIAAGARAMRAAATRVQSLSANTLDTVGTGGDGGMTFNVSTTVAFVVAAAGPSTISPVTLTRLSPSFATLSLFARTMRSPPPRSR